MADRTGSQRLVQRLRKAPPWRQRAAEVLVSALLEAKLDALLPPARLASVLADAIRKMAQDPEFEAVLATWLEEALDRVCTHAGSSPLGTCLPPDGVEVLARALSRPYVPDRALVAELLDHEAMRRLLRTVLADTIDRFTARILDLLPGGRVLSGLAGRARGLVGAGTPAAVEALAREFVDTALAEALRLVVDFSVDPANAEMVGRWRGDALRVLAAQPADRLVAELQRTDPRALAQDLKAGLETLARWEGLTPAVEGLLEESLEVMGADTLADLLEALHLTASVRPVLELLAGEALAAVAASPAFEALVADLLAADDP